MTHSPNHLIDELWTQEEQRSDETNSDGRSGSWNPQPECHAFERSVVLAAPTAERGHHRAALTRIARAVTKSKSKVKSRRRRGRGIWELGNLGGWDSRRGEAVYSVLPWSCLVLEHGCGIRVPGNCRESKVEPELKANLGT